METENVVGEIGRISWAKKEHEQFFCLLDMNTSNEEVAFCVYWVFMPAYYAYEWALEALVGAFIYQSNSPPEKE